MPGSAYQLNRFWAYVEMVPETDCWLWAGPDASVGENPKVASGDYPVTPDTPEALPPVPEAPPHSRIHTYDGYEHCKCGADWPCSEAPEGAVAQRDRLVDALYAEVVSRRNWMARECGTDDEEKASAELKRWRQTSGLFTPLPPCEGTRIIARTHEILAAQGRVADMILRKTGRMAVGLDDWATIDSLCVAVAIACGCVLESEGNMMRIPE